jgi:hypothetical protein
LSSYACHPIHSAGSCRHGRGDAQDFALALEIIVREVQANRRAMVPFYERTLLRRSSLQVFHAS